MKFCFFLIACLYTIVATAQTGSPAEPVRYIGGTTIDPTLHEGRLRWAVGTESVQVLRANRTHPEEVDGFGWTYNHAPNLAYWKGKFYLQYLSNPKDEHVAPGHTMLATSSDGRHWEQPQEAFPPYQAPDGVKIPEGYHGYMMHQRMGFYTASNGKLLLLAFYGHTDHPFNEGGIGRVVREVKENGSLGPIYFIRYSSYTDFDESNTSYPLYTKAKDPAFVAACKELLGNKLQTLQWQNEDFGQDDFYPQKNLGDSLEALSWFHRKDGKVVALWKFSLAAISDDEGASFSDPVKVPTLLMAGGKNWGQQTDDGRYAMLYNPIELQEYRFPLIVVSGDDGMLYDNMLLVQGEVPPRRFFGRWKDFGACYVRGIIEGNGNPPGNDMWVTYSMNKEDIWISRVPTTIRYAVEGPVNDTFENMTPDSTITDWNTYSPQWAPVKVVHTSKGNQLQLSDKDPYDYARAIRVFEEGSQASISMDVTPENTDGHLEIEVTDQFGNRPIRLILDEEGDIKAFDGSQEKIVGSYQAGNTYQIALSVNATPYGSFNLSINGKQVLKEAALCVAVKSVERLSLRTGSFRTTPTRKTPNQEKKPPLKGADEPMNEAVYLIDNVVVK